MANFLKLYLFRLKLRIILIFSKLFYKVNIDCPYLVSQRYVEFNWVINNLNFKGKVLDIGCANSILPSFLTSKFKLNIYALDLDKSIKSQIIFKKLLNLKKLQVLKADAVYLPFKSNSFDNIICVSAIEHFEDNKDSLLLKEIYRVLKKEGKAIITTQAANNYEEIFKKENVYSKKYAGEPIFFERRYDKESLKKRISKATPLKTAKIEFFKFNEKNYFISLLKVFPFKGVKIFLNVLLWERINKLNKHIFGKGPVCCIVLKKEK